MATSEESVLLDAINEEALAEVVYECIANNLHSGLESSQDATLNLSLLDPVLSLPPRKKPNWKVPENDERVMQLVPMVEEQYLGVIKEMNKVGAVGPSNLHFSQHASVDRLLSIKKHMINVMCDVFTDPSVIQTVKMGVVSRVLKEEDDQARAREARRKNAASTPSHVGPYGE